YSGMFAFLETHFPKQGELFRKLFGETPHTLTPENGLLPLCKHLIDSEGFTILTMVATHCGVHRSKIIFRLGQRGLDKLEDLKKDGLVKEDSAGFLVAVEPDFSVVDLDTLVAQVSHIAENIKRTRKGLLTIQSEGLNDDGVDRVQNLIRETTKQIEAILKEKQYRGNRTVAINLQQAFID
ncbi:MAG: hypothetical protein KBD78_05610, partial [Oligoflexales bacterium]|nr:hypothetical protein [Oligoflexales bacterium]